MRSVIYVVSYQRHPSDPTTHFLAETEKAAEAWVRILYDGAAQAWWDRYE